MAQLSLDNACVEFALPVRLADIAGRARQRLLGGAIDHGRRTLRALDSITLEVREGDRLGIVGHNGAGKTTLLRVLAGIYVPTSGRARVSGRISTLINSLPGLDPDDTGLGNIRSCALLLGMPPAGLKRRIDDIVAASELGEYLGLPVRVYSAGMLTRLAFAIATAIDPEVLILDEGLSTGDAAFAARAEARIRDLIARSVIVVFASHSIGMLKSICTTGLVLEQGRMVAHGSIGSAIDTYLARLVDGAARGEQSQLDAAFTAAQDLARRGERVPLQVEEQALRAGLQRVPGDRPMQLRLVQVLRGRGLAIPPELEIVELEEAARHDTDPARYAARLAQLRAQLAAQQVAS